MLSRTIKTNNNNRYESLDDKSKNSTLAKSKNAISQSIVSKLYRNRDWTLLNNISDIGSFSSIVNNITNNIDVYENILSQFGDIRAAINIRACIILSPTDITTTTLNYKSISRIIPPVVISEMTDVIKEIFDEGRYDLKENLKRIATDVIGSVGSYALAIIPEPAIDDIINDTDTVAIEKFKSKLNARTLKHSSGNIFGTESYKNPSIKYGDNKEKTITAESIFKYVINEDVRSITDAYSSFYNGSIIREQAYRESFNNIDNLNDVINVDEVATEGIGDDNSNDEKLTKGDFLKLKNNLFQSKPYSNKKVLRINEVDWSVKPAVGHPIVLHIDSRSVIPIHVPGDPNNHIGYIIPSDKYNMPITDLKPSTNLDRFMNGGGTNDGVGSTYEDVIGGISKYGYGDGNNCDFKDAVDTPKILAFAKRVIEDDVTYRLSKGTYNSSSLKISCPENVALLMLSYRLADLDIVLQFIPATLMTYFRIKVNEAGVGVSALEDIKYPAALRASTQLANTMAAVKNSIGITKMDLVVDAYQPDIKKTINNVTSLAMKNRSLAKITTNANPSALANALAATTTQLKVTTSGGKDEGGIDPLSATTLDITEISGDYKGVEPELMDALKDQTLLGVGVPTSIVQSSNDANFAIEVLYDNQMLVRQGLEDKKHFDRGLTSHVKQFSMNSGVVMKKLSDIVRKNIKDIAPIIKGTQIKTVRDVVEEFIESIVVSLPEPNLTKYKAQKDLLEEYIDLLDKATEVIITNGIIGKLFNDTNSADDSGDRGVSEENITDLIKSHLVKAFMQQNGILPDLFNIFDDNIQDINLISVLESEVEESGELMRVYKLVKLQIEKSIQEIKVLNDNIAEATGEETTSSDGFDMGSSPPNDDDEIVDDTDDIPLDESVGVDMSMDTGMDAGFEGFKGVFMQGRIKK